MFSRRRCPLRAWPGRHFLFFAHDAADHIHHSFEGVCLGASAPLGARQLRKNPYQLQGAVTALNAQQFQDGCHELLADVAACGLLAGKGLKKETK